MSQVRAPDVLVEPASADDAPALAAFWAERFAATFAPLYPPSDLAAYLADAYAPERIAAEIADPDYQHRLARRDGRLIGALKGGRVGLPISAADAWELHRLYVTDDVKGKGLADSLMLWGQAQARALGKRALVLGVYSDNQRAQRFYVRHGFRKIGEYQFPVGATLDLEWIMRRELPPLTE